MLYRWIYGFEEVTHAPFLIKTHSWLRHDFQAITSTQYQDYGEKVGGAGEGGGEYTPPANLVFIWKLPWGFSIILPPYPGWPWRESPRLQRSMQSRLSPHSPSILSPLTAFGDSGIPPLPVSFSSSLPLALADLPLLFSNPAPARSVIFSFRLPSLSGLWELRKVRQVVPANQLCHCPSEHPSVFWGRVKNSPIWPRRDAITVELPLLRQSGIEASLQDLQRVHGLWCTKAFFCLQQISFAFSQMLKSHFNA